MTAPFLRRFLLVVYFCKFEYARSTYFGPSEGDIRLVDGIGISGRVEIYYNQEWGTVCDDDFDILDAKVICRQLGYIDAIVHMSAHFGGGRGQIWLDDVGCYGNESRLADCSHRGWGSHNCGHSEDAGVRCLTTPYDCNFESGFCMWTQDTNDHLDWTRNRGSTASDDTGPSVDHTYGKGYYAYMETSGGFSGNTANLVSPLIRPTEVTYLHFWYHMYGPDINTLSVYIRYLNQSRSLVWSKTGTQGNQWYVAFVNVVNQLPFHIVFQGISGSGFKGDIAIDDILFSEAPYLQLRVRTPPYDCDFEYGLCHWTQSKFDNFDWRSHQGPSTLPDTGPSVDHTFGTANGHYVYIDTSTGSPNDTALLVSPLMGPTRGTCLHFWYHMFGTEVNTLNLYILPLKQSRSALWSITGGRGNHWYSASVNVVSQSPFQILVEGVRGTGYKGDIAIDDIAFKFLPNGQLKVAALPYGCNFEYGFCKWTQDNDDNFNWTRHKGPTPSPNTGPLFDHTFANVNGYYIYIEATSKSPHDTALLVSPTIKPTGGSCLHFWYHMYGSDVNTLNVYIQFINQPRKDLWTRTGTLDNKWHNASVNVASKLPFHIMFEGVRGEDYQSDIAVDDIAYTFAPCGETKDISSRDDYTIRLVGGGEPWRGRLEVKYDGQWGTVCNNGFGTSEATAICNELGYNSREPHAYQNAVYGAGSGPIWLDEVRCRDDSTQTYLRNCTSNQWGLNDCDHSMDVSINCIQDNVYKHDGVKNISGIRLTNGGEQWKGRLEVYHDGMWGTVSDDGFGVNEAHAVCKELGYDTAHRSDPWGTYSCGYTENVYVDCVQAKPIIIKAEYNVHSEGNNLLEDGTSIQVKENDSLLLTMVTYANPAAAVRLFKEQDEIKGTLTSLLDVNYNQVKCQQTGIYAFEATNIYNAGKPLRLQFNIDVNCIPREQQSPKSQREYIGKHDDTVILSEIVISNPAPNVTWDKNVKPFPVEKYNAYTYRISGKVHITGQNDYGTYTTALKNQEGELVIEFSIRQEENRQMNSQSNIGLVVVSIILGLVCCAVVSIAICICIRRRATQTKKKEGRDNPYELSHRGRRSPQGRQIEGTDCQYRNESYELPPSSRPPAKGETNEIEMDEDYYEVMDRASKTASNIYQNVA